MRGDKGFCVNLCDSPEMGTYGRARTYTACNKHSFAISIVRWRQSVAAMAEVIHYMRFKGTHKVTCVILRHLYMSLDIILESNMTKMICIKAMIARAWVS